MSTIAKLPGTLELTSGYNLTHKVVVPRIESTDAYRTLGVRVSPSGDNNLAYSTLRDQSKDFAVRIASSHLTREAAYWAYWQYYKPKSGLSVPALTLTQTQCDRIQGPAVSATLSKLHLNRNTSSAVVFGPSKYAGLGLPSLFTTKSIGQLCLLLGHLRLKDKTARLLLIDMSFIQLLVGSTTLFFNLPFQCHSHSVDHNWLVTIW